MTAEDDHGTEPEDDAGIWARSTAPQSEFSSGQVTTGFVVLAIGLLVAFVLPLLLV